MSAGRLPLVCSATMWTSEHLHALVGVTVTLTSTYSFLKLPKPFFAVVVVVGAFPNAPICIRSEDFVLKYG